MHPRRYLLWFLFVPSALVATGLVFIPLFIIRPFRHQSPSALALAMALRPACSLDNSRGRYPLSVIAAPALAKC